MDKQKIESLFTTEWLAQLLPADRSDRFFEALFGDADEGAYDISLHYNRVTKERLALEFRLQRRPSKCLARHLTYGLPKVFERHPQIDIKGIVAQINTRLDDGMQCRSWQLGPTHEISRDLHTIPLMIELGD